MQKLMDQRYPIYATADVTVESRDVQHTQMVNEVIKILARWPGWERLNECKHLTAGATISYPSEISGREPMTFTSGKTCCRKRAALIAPLLNRPFVAIVTDENVARHHLKTLEASLAAAGITFGCHHSARRRKNQKLHRTG